MLLLLPLRRACCRRPAAATAEAKVDVDTPRCLAVEARHDAAVPVPPVLRQLSLCAVCHERILAVLLLAQEVVRPASSREDTSPDLLINMIGNQVPECLEVAYASSFLL